MVLFEVEARKLDNKVFCCLFGKAAESILSEDRTSRCSVLFFADMITSIKILQMLKKTEGR